MALWSMKRGKPAINLQSCSLFEVSQRMVFSPRFVEWAVAARLQFFHDAVQFILEKMGQKDS